MSDTKTDPKATEGTEGANGNKRGRKPGQIVTKPDTSAFDLSAIAGAVAAPAEVRELAQPRVERKPEQIAMDAVVKRAHEAWEKAGKPNAWAKMPVVTYYLDPTHVEGYKYLIRRAADFHGLRPRFGSPARVSKALAAKIGHVEFEGREILAWAAMDKRPRTEAKPATDKPATDAK